MIKYAKMNQVEVSEEDFWSDIDEGIRDLVRLIMDDGFRTMGSCEGGEGHCFNLPTIQIENQSDLDTTRKELCAFLLEKGLSGFTVKTVSMHQKSLIPENYSYVEVEFWEKIKGENNV